MGKKVIRLTEQELNTIIKQVISESLSELDSRDAAVGMKYNKLSTNDILNGNTSVSFGRQAGIKDPIERAQKSDNLQFSLLTQFIKTHSSNLRFYFLKQAGRNTIIEFDFDRIQFLDNERLVMVGNASISSSDRPQTNKAIQYSLSQKRFYEVIVLGNGATRRTKEIILPITADGGLQRQNRENLILLFSLINEFIDRVNTDPVNRADYQRKL